MEPRPDEQLADKYVTHYLLDVTVTVSECLGTARERLHKTRLIVLAVESQRERLLARFDDLMSSQHYDSRYQLHWDALTE